MDAIRVEDLTKVFRVQHKEPGTELEVEIRSQRAKAKVVPLPFYKRKK
jgi:glycine cleavage system aminomethyltransferase T